jgi:hypothetical protein
MGTNASRATLLSTVKRTMPSSLFCKRCMSFVPHDFRPVLQPDMRLRIRTVCTQCDHAGARIGHQAAVAEGTGARLERGPEAAE